MNYSGMSDIGSNHIYPQKYPIRFRDAVHHHPCFPKGIIVCRGIHQIANPAPKMLEVVSLLQSWMMSGNQNAVPFICRSAPHHVRRTVSLERYHLTNSLPIFVGIVRRSCGFHQYLVALVVNIFLDLVNPISFWNEITW